MSSSVSRPQVVQTTSNKHDLITHILEVQPNLLFDNIESFDSGHHMLNGHPDPTQLSIFLLLLLSQFTVFRFFVWNQYANIVWLIALVT